jgi:hypothetical protein
MRIEQIEARRIGEYGRAYNRKVKEPTYHHRIGNASLCVHTIQHSSTPHHALPAHIIDILLLLSCSLMTSDREVILPFEEVDPMLLMLGVKLDRLEWGAFVGLLLSRGTAV